MTANSRTAFDAATSRNLDTPTGSSTEPRRYKFSLDEAYVIGETGIFRGKRVELIGGQFLVKEPPSSFHAGMVNRLLNRLTEMAGSRTIVSAQNPVVLSQFDVPEPDIAILKPRDDFYTSQHPEPEDVYLVVEVSNTSLRYDQSTKGSLYAAAGIGSYWIVDMNAEIVLVHEDPTPDGYDTVRTVERGATLTVPGPVNAAISVGDLFPRDSDKSAAS